jgi:hypothetical protein
LLRSTFYILNLNVNVTIGFAPNHSSVIGAAMASN